MCAYECARARVYVRASLAHIYTLAPNAEFGEKYVCLSGDLLFPFIARVSQI